ALPEPVGEVEDHSGEESRLGDAQQEAHDVQVRNGVGKCGGSGDNAPGDQDAANPDAGADLVQEDVTANLEEKVADEEDAGQQAKLLGRDGQLLVHGQGGEPDIDAIKNRNDVKEKHEGEEPHLDLADGPGFDVG